MIVTQQPAESFAASDLPAVISHVVFRRDQLVVETLVIPLVMIMLDELRDCVTQ